MTTTRAHVLTCTTFDAETHACTEQTWMPAPYLLPAMSTTQALILLSAALVPLATAWGVKHLGRSIKN